MANILGSIGQAAPFILGAGQQGEQMIQGLMAMLANAGRYNEAKNLQQGMLSGNLQHPFLAGLPGIGQFFQQRDASTSMPAQYAQLAGGLLDRYNQNLQSAPGQWQGLTNDINRAYGTLANGTVGQLWDRYHRNMGTLEGAGTQERADINRQFNDYSAANQADAVSRGLTGTLVPNTVGANIERNRSDALGGLNERLLQQRLGLDTSLSGDAINAGQNIGQNWINAQQNLGTQGYANYQNLLGSTLGNAWQLGQAPLQSQQGLTSDLINLIGQRYDTYPNQGLNVQLQSNLGASAAPAASYPSGSQALWGGIGGGLGQGLGTAGGLAATKWAFGCLDANTTMIETSEGHKPLIAIEEGEYVRASDKLFKRVLFKDCGDAQNSRSSYIKLRTTLGELTCTRDHVIQGKPADVWCAGDYIGNGRVTEVAMVDTPTIAADLWIDDGSDYMANGLRVASMIFKMGLTVDELRAMRDKQAAME